MRWSDQQLVDRCVGGRIVGEGADESLGPAIEVEGQRCRVPGLARKAWGAAGERGNQERHCRDAGSPAAHLGAWYQGLTRPGQNRGRQRTRTHRRPLPVCSPQPEKTRTADLRRPFQTARGGTQTRAQLHAAGVQPPLGAFPQRALGGAAHDRSKPAHPRPAGHRPSGAERADPGRRRTGRRLPHNIHATPVTRGAVCEAAVAEAEVVDAMGGEEEGEDKAGDAVPVEEEAEVAVDGDGVARLETDGLGKTGGPGRRNPAFPTGAIDWPCSPEPNRSRSQKERRKCLIIERFPDNFVDGPNYDFRNSGVAVAAGRGPSQSPKGQARDLTRLEPLHARESSRYHGLSDRFVPGRSPVWNSPGCSRKTLVCDSCIEVPESSVSIGAGNDFPGAS